MVEPRWDKRYSCRFLSALSRVSITCSADVRKFKTSLYVTYGAVPKVTSSVLGSKTVQLRLAERCCAVAALLYQRIFEARHCSDERAGPPPWREGRVKPIERPTR